MRDFPFAGSQTRCVQSVCLNMRVEKKRKGDGEREIGMQTYMCPYVQVGVSV